MRLLYTISVYIYATLSLFASLFSPKARLWNRGRKKLISRMEKAAEKTGTGSVIWFHCASLGEFEQGRPVIEQFRQDFPQWRILLTFFSPSGYEIRRDYPHADHVFYLPLDTPCNVSRFLDTWKPVMAVFVKYEFWFNFLHALDQRKIPLYIVSAIFRPSQHFFKWYGGWALRHLKCVTRIFVQDAGSADLLSEYGVHNVITSGDTRFDRVYALKETPAHYPLVEGFAEGYRLIIAGSTWSPDEKLLESLSLDHIRIVIAPHEVNKERINELMNQWEGLAIRYSELEGSVPAYIRVLIIDQIGMLSSLYQYGELALIGGGFGKGIHNTLEAAAFGLPVFFGPNYEKFAEARDLIALGGAFCVRTPNEFKHHIDLFFDEHDRLQEVSAICKEYVVRNRGATDAIMNELQVKATHQKSVL